VSPRGIGLIIRSIQATVGLSLTAEEDALLRSVDANAEDVVPWPQDVERYGPVLDNLRLLLRGAEDREGWIWLSAQDTRWWVENSSEALREYEEELRASDPVLLDHLVSRHVCLLFGSFDLDTFARQVQRPRQGGALTQHQEYAQLLDAIAQSCHRLGITATTKAYWSWQFLNFDRTQIAGDPVLYNNPLLALWNTWPASSWWAPARPEEIEVAPPLTAEVAAEYLETVLWRQIETIFAYLTLDCGLPRGATIRSTGRETGAPVYYFATPAHPPSTPEHYRALQGAPIHPLIRTCLYTDDPLSDRIAWGVVQGRAVTLRCEIAFEQFRPWILLFPLADERLSEEDREISLEQVVAQIAFSLTFIELTIDMKSANVEQEMLDTGAEVDPWLGILERGNEITERAIALVPIVGQTDRTDLARRIKYLQGPLRRLSARFEQTRSDLARIERSFGAAKDATEDTLRKLTLRGLSAPGVRSLHGALLDAYPYHYLEEPLRNVRGRVETALSLTTQVTNSIEIVLTETEQTAHEFQERWTTRLAVVISLLALLIGLPTFVPGATLSEETYPQGLNNIIPLSLAEGVLRTLAATFAVGAALFLIIVLVSWIQRFQPTQEYDVERFALLLERVKGAVRDNLDESNLEALDIEGTQIFGRIWRQVEQSTGSRPQTVQRWSWRLSHAMELSYDIRVF